MAKDASVKSLDDFFSLTQISDNPFWHPVSTLRTATHLQAIDFNAADTGMVTALEALPNVGSVSVTREGPDGQLGYSWYITFVENPGSFPAASGDVALMAPDFSGLTGDGALCTAEESSAGTPELSGAFVLAFTSSAESGGVTRYTDELPYNSLAEEVRHSIQLRPGGYP